MLKRLHEYIDVICLFAFIHTIATKKVFEQEGSLHAVVSGIWGSVTICLNPYVVTSGFWNVVRNRFLKYVGWVCCFTKVIYSPTSYVNIRSSYSGGTLWGNFTFTINDSITFSKLPKLIYKLSLICIPNILCKLHEL